MNSIPIPILLLIPSALFAGQAAAQPDVQQIVARSLANSQADWKAAPGFAYTEHDVNGKGDRTYRVRMIGGSPYYELIAMGEQPLSDKVKAAEDAKLRRVEQQRQHESSSERTRRIANYEKGRRQDHELMKEMIAGFTFHLEGTETASGRKCYKIAATPNPKYVPKSRDTQVLKGMRGTLWIDAQAYQWVRVEAGVFRPVAFGLFVAHVEPGTEFTLEQSPVEGNIWMPTYFEQQVNAKVLFFERKSLDQETYSDYKPSGGGAASK